MKTFINFLFLTMASFASASSTEFGNGGNAVVCPGPVKMYDVLEASARYSLTPAFPKMPRAQVCQQQKDSCTLIAKAIVSRLKNVDPDLEATLQKLIDVFWKEAMLTYADLLPVNDTGVGFIEHGCELKQLALQHEPLFAEDSRYFIANRLWVNMFDDHRAALIVHEVLYNHALQLVPETKSSERIRYFNALLISNRVSELSPEQYQAIKIKVFPTASDQ